MASIQTEQTPQDLVEFIMHYHQNSRTTQRSFWGPMAIFLLVIAFCLFASLRSSDFIQTTIALLPLWVFGVVGLIYLLLWKRFALRAYTRRYLAEGNNKSLFGPHQLSITPDGVSDAGELRSSSATWKAVERIEVLPEVMYIYFSAMEVYIVPKRAFASEAAFNEAVEAAQSYHRQFG